MPGRKGSVAERKARTQQILNLNREGLTNKQISERLGFSRHYVCWALRREGVRFNGPGKTKVLVANDGTVECSTCGSRSDVNSHQRKSGYVIGVCRDCRNKQKKRWRNQNVFAYRVHSIRTLCKREGLPFGLTADFLRSLYEQQRGLCFYTDRPMTLELTSRGSSRFTALSVDRIEPQDGYIPGNVVLCVLRANTVKNDLTMDEIKDWLPGWYERIQKYLSETFGKERL